MPARWIRCGCLLFCLAASGCFDPDTGTQAGGAGDPCAAVDGPDGGIELTPPGDFARNVVLLLADGVGVVHWEAARLSGGGSLALDDLQGPTLYGTDSLTEGPTDSAAGATAMATGHCTGNAILGATPEGEPLPNLFELAAAASKRRGLVTNTILIDASPMAFAVHSRHRFCSDQIAELLFVDGPELLLGGFMPDSFFGVEGLDELATASGYEVGFELRTLQLADDAAPVLGLFGEGPSSASWPDWEWGLTPEVLRSADNTEPTLAELTAFALERLASGPDGFVLMVENEHPDTVGHNAYLDVASAAAWMPELVRELDSALAVVLGWVETSSSFDETLVVVASDHETGGYTLGDTDRLDPALASFPASPNHTRVSVPIYARGPGSERLQDITHSADIFHLLTGNTQALPGTGDCSTP